MWFDIQSPQDKQWKVKTLLDCECVKIEYCDGTFGYKLCEKHKP